MNPFQPGHDWYEKHWYSPEPATKTWRVTSAIASVAALVLAVWLR
jgi:hypothetical protein